MELNLLGSNVNNADRRESQITKMSGGISLDLQEDVWDSEWIKWKKFIFLTLTDQNSNQSARYLNRFFQILIVVNLFSYAIETMSEFMDTPFKRGLWFSLDVVAGVIFSLDYLGKVIFIPNYNDLPRMVTTTGWLIDFIALVPFYIQFFFDYTNSPYLGILRLTRILRLYRFFKLSYAPRQSQIFVIAFLRSKDALSMLGFVIAVYVLVFSTFIYYAEMTIETPVNNLWVYSSGPNVGTISPFQNIISSIWFTVETASTVGYGDVIPSSILGKIVSSFIALGGLFIFAFPVSILGIRMNEVYSEFLAKDTAVRLLNEEMIPLKKRVKWNIEELSPEREELVQKMLQNLYGIEETIKKHRKTLEHTGHEMFMMRNCLASFGGEDLKKYSSKSKI